MYMSLLEYLCTTCMQEPAEAGRGHQNPGDWS